ncbi:MAG TPA: flavin reductase family protein [Baekduia sp.]|uniref:flavin reductase family protein n=1 Tax=Baekduia sp. TaxID=2600305 RepID=UPI002D76B498|nr:flavin reductase family protein [Baekduia sp.]HET6509865.1 flavin reductase family protein [Baekduia sp.]
MSATALGPTALRAAMGHFATGVTIITAPGAPPRGSTVNAITSVSLDPPLLLVCLRDGSRTLAALLEAERFAVNVLHADQAALAERFATRGVPPWDGVGHAAGPATGAPLLHGAVATLECALHDVADGGDHRIVVGRVLAVAHPEEHVPPLLFYRGAFTALGR